jgi:hypothetical protein
MGFMVQSNKCIWCLSVATWFESLEPLLSCDKKTAKYAISKKSNLGERSRVTTCKENQAHFFLSLFNAYAKLIKKINMMFGNTGNGKGISSRCSPFSLPSAILFFHNQRSQFNILFLKGSCQMTEAQANRAYKNYQIKKQEANFKGDETR